MAAPAADRSFFGDLGGVWSRRGIIWRLVPQGDKLRFGAAGALMALVALVETGIALLLGRFFDRVLKLTGQPAGEILRFAAFSLGVLAGAYILKETLNFLRRGIISRTTTRIERDMTVRLVGHLLKVDLGALARERVGALSGRISRSVEGYVKFLKVSFTDAIPAVLTALFALAAGFFSEWRVGLIRPASCPWPSG